MRARSQIANTTIYLAFSIASSGIGFLAVLVLTRLLPTSEYGRIGLFFSALYFIAPLVSIAADGLVSVNKSTLSPERYRTFQQTYVGLAMMCFGACQLVTTALWLSGIIPDALIMAAPAFALVRFFATMAGTEYVMEQRAITYGSLTLATSAIGLLLTITLCWVFGGSSVYRVFSMFLADLILLGIRYRGRSEILMKPRIDSDFALQIFHFGVPSVIAIAGGWGLNEADKVIVAKTAGLSATGIYTAAAALAAIMATFNQSLTNALYPGLFRALGEDVRVRKVLATYVAKFASLSSAFAVIGIGLYFLFADRLLPARYLGGKSIFVALMLAGVATSIYRPFGLAADFYRLARIRAVAVLVGGGGAIALGWFGISRDGNLLWAPAGMACGYALASLVTLVGLKLARQRTIRAASPQQLEVRAENQS